MKLFVGEDVLTARCDNSAELTARMKVFEQSGYWQEVVRGMTDLSVKYDPLIMSSEMAEARFIALWEQPIEVDAIENKPLLLDFAFDQTSAPDRQMVAEALGLGPVTLPDWFMRRHYRVTMMGFQPGFAYLEDLGADNLPELPRLPTPRQFVAAGSIGFLGRRVCIYALDGPGGWPIVGRVSQPLFRRDAAQPFLLTAGQQVRFRPT